MVYFIYKNLIGLLSGSCYIYFCYGLIVKSEAINFVVACFNRTVLVFQLYEYSTVLVRDQVRDQHILYSTVQKLEACGDTNPVQREDTTPEESTTALLTLSSIN